MTQHYEASFRGTGLRATQFTLLAMLTQTGPLPLTVMAEKLGLERTSLTRNLRPLEKRGFVRIMSEEDQRVRRIMITKKGEKAALASLDAWSLAQAAVDDVLRGTGIEKILASTHG